MHLLSYSVPVVPCGCKPRKGLLFACVPGVYGFQRRLWMQLTGELCYTF